MKAAIVLVLLIVGTAGAFYVAWMNRNSEKIVSAVIPISVGALVGIFMAVFVFGGTTPTSKEFPVTLFFEAPANTPVSLPFRPIAPALFHVPELIKTEPDALKNSDAAMLLYHHLLQRAIIDNLALRYGHAWRVKINRFETSMGNEMTAQPSDGQELDGRKISGEELQAILGSNRFGRLSNAQLVKLTLPPGTDLRLQPPEISNGSEESSIVMDNPFVRLTLRTRRTSWGVLFGDYRFLLGEPNDTNTNLRQISFIVSAKTEFKRLRTGHPDMPKYRAWAHQVVDEIQNEFDEQAIWRRSKERYIFARQLPLGAVTQNSVLRFETH